MTANEHESTGRAGRYAQHIRDLAKAFNVVIIERATMDPAMAGASVGAVSKQPGILIAPVIDDSTYAVALHELGHCASPTGMLESQMSRMYQITRHPTTTRDVLLELEAERSAWIWAHHYALEWTLPMTYVERISMGSYEQHARRLLGKIPK